MQSFPPKPYKYDNCVTLGLGAVAIQETVCLKTRDFQAANACFYVNPHFLLMLQALKRQDMDKIPYCDYFAIYCDYCGVPYDMLQMWTVD